ncbi:MAG: type II secretion system protein GspM [Thermodesulfobacteriota bacterium]
MTWKEWSFINLKTSTYSQKKVLWVGGAAALSLLIYFLGVLPLSDAARRAQEEIVLKKNILLRYKEYLQNRKKIEEELDQAQKRYAGLQQRLLSGETPQLGAAQLQEIVRRLSEKNGIAIRSFRILEPKETYGFTRISLHIEFNPVNNMLSLGQFIHDIEQQEKELMISEADLLVPNPRMPNSVQGSLVISGLMKTSPVKEKGKEG